MKHLKLALAAGVLCFGISNAHAQTYKSDFSTQVTLAGGTGVGGGTNTMLTTTLNAGTPAAALTFTLPSAYPADATHTFLLTSTTLGGMSWVDALTLTTFNSNGNTNIDVPASAGATGTTNINDGAGMKLGLINIGNSGSGTPGTPDSSVTTMNGAVNFTGTVTLPAGAISPSSLPLANNDVYVGVGGDADSARIIQDVTLSGATSNTVTATVNSASGTAFAVLHNISIGGGQRITGADTVGGNLDIASGSSVAGNDTVVGTFNANGSANVDATPSIAGTINIGNSSIPTADDTSTTNVYGYLNINGPTTINNNLHVTGLVSSGSVFTGLEGIAGPLTVGGVSTLRGVIDTGNFANVGNFSVTGGQRITGADTVGGNLDIAGGSSVAGNDTVVGTFNANGNANIDAAVPGNKGTITIGNNGNNGALPDSSVTTMNGAVDFTGTVNLPAGSISPSSLPLANNDIYVGVGGDADSARIIQDVTLSGATSSTVTATVNSASGPKFSVTGYEDITGGQNVGGADTVTGQSTLGSTAFSAATAVNVTAGGVIVVGNAHSYIPLTTTAAQAASSTGISGENVAAGQMIVFSNTGANNITLHSNGTFLLNGGDVIMGPGGTATIIYDGTNWRLIGAE